MIKILLSLDSLESGHSNQGDAPSSPRTSRDERRRNISSLYLVRGFKTRSGPPLWDIGAGVKVTRKSTADRSGEDWKERFEWSRWISMKEHPWMESRAVQMVAVAHLTI